MNIPSRGCINLTGGVGGKVAATSSLSGLSSGFTYFCLFRARSLTAFGGLICNATGSTDRACLSILSGTHLVTAGYFNGSIFKGAASNVAPFSPVGWHSVLYAYDGTTGSMWLDGILQTGTSTPNTATTNALVIGAVNDGTKPFPGNMAKVMIWNRALGQTEAMAVIKTGYVSPSGLKLWYPFNEGSGAVAHDLSGNTNNGTITLGYWSKDLPRLLRPKRLEALR